MSRVSVFRLRQTDESPTAPPRPGPSYFARTPDIPAAHEGVDGEYVDPWWGEGPDWSTQDRGLEEPPGLSFGPCSQPPPLSHDRERERERYFGSIKRRTSFSKMLRS